MLSALKQIFLQLAKRRELPRRRYEPVKAVSFESRYLPAVEAYLRCRTQLPTKLAKQSPDGEVAN